MIRHRVFTLLLATMCSLAPLWAELSSPELKRLQVEIEPFLLPPSVGSNIIPQINLKDVGFDIFSKMLEPHGVTVITSQSLQDARLNIALRNLSINRVLQFSTQQVGGNWFYDNGRVIIFRSQNELNTDFQKIYAQKANLDQQIRNEKRRLGDIYAEGEAKVLRNTMVPEFSVQDRTIDQIIKELCSITVDIGYADGKGINIAPLFDPKSYRKKQSYTFKNKSIAEILDTICEEFQMTWRAGPSALTVAPR